MGLPRKGSAIYSREVIFFFIAALGAASGPDASAGIAISNGSRLTAGPATNANPAVDRELQKLIDADEAAQAEVNKWVQAHQALDAADRVAAQAGLDRRIQERCEPVGRAYSDFLSRHPRHVPALLAYGSFLQARDDESGAQIQWEKVLEVDPRNADAHHNLACRYTETGQVKKAFDFFSKSVELNPAEAVYYYNFANALYVMRSQATLQYKLTEQEVFAKVLGLYSNSVRLDPANFDYAADLAQTYYAVRPFPADQAFKAWTETLRKAHDQAERQHVHVHLARVEMLAGRLVEARAQLSVVTNATFSGLKSNLFRAIAVRESENQGTNATALGGGDTSIK